MTLKRYSLDNLILFREHHCELFLISLSFVKFIRIKSRNCSQTVEGLFIHLVVYLVGMSCNMSLLYRTRNTGFLHDRVTRHPSDGVNLNFSCQTTHRYVESNVWSFFSLFKQEQCNTMQHSIIHMKTSDQRKVLIKVLMNAIPTTSAELSGPRDKYTGEWILLVLRWLQWKKSIVYYVEMHKELWLQAKQDSLLEQSINCINTNWVYIVKVLGCMINNWGIYIWYKYNLGPNSYLMFSKRWEISHSSNVFSANKIIKTMWAVKEDWRHKITYTVSTATLTMKYKQLFHKQWHKIREHVSWKEEPGQKYHTKSESSNTINKVPYMHLQFASSITWHGIVLPLRWIQCTNVEHTTQAMGSKPHTYNRGQDPVPSNCLDTWV